MNAKCGKFGSLIRARMSFTTTMAGKKNKVKKKRTTIIILKE